MENPNVVVLAGPNGAGKSTVAPFLLRDSLEVTEFVNADVLARGLSGFDVDTAAMAAGRIMLRRLRVLAERRIHFAFETTLASRSFAPWLQSLSEGGYGIRLVYLWLPSPEMAVGRVTARVRDGGHDIPEMIVRRRYHRSARNFFELYAPIAGTWCVYDNSHPTVPGLIAQGSIDGSEEVLHELEWKRFRAACG